MESTVNERIISVKNHLKLTDIDFSHKAKISTGTLFHIKNNKNVSSKTIDSICQCLGVSREWLLHGTGEMFLPGQSTESIPVSESVWKDEAYQALKEEVKYLREMLKLAMTGTKSFPNDIIGAGLINSFEKFGNIVRA